MRVGWRGPVLDRSPWAAGSRAFLAGLRAAGAEVALEALLWEQGNVLSPSEEAALAELAAVPLDDLAAGIQQVPARILDPYAPGRVRVARTTLPGGVPGEDWMLRLGQMDDVWVPSAAQCDALVGAGLAPGRVTVVPEPLLMPADACEPIAVAGLHGTIFLAIVDLTPRSGWEILLDAWCRAFTPDDDLTLLMHVFSSDGVEVDYGERAVECARRLGHDPERMPDVVLLEESIPASAIGSLYAVADVVCSPARGLGRGRDLLEAMAHRRPVIACPDAVGEPIDDAVGWSLPAGPGGGPDRGALVAALRDARVRRSELAAMGTCARERVARHHAAAVVGELAMERLARIEPSPRRHRPGTVPRVALYGAVTRAHSLATANRNLAAALVRAGEIDLSLVEVELGDVGASDALPTGDVRRAAHRLFDRPPEVTIRHGYPPSFARPPSGRLVVALPWEFGPIPRDWLRAINEGGVDEVWACSHHLRDAYLSSGLGPEVVHMVPHGIDPLRFRPGLEPLAMPGVSGGYRFLFVGGLLWRKGIDILLDAYRAAFDASEDVTLVVKDFGRGGPYQPQDAEERVRRMSADRSGPRVEFLRERLSDDEIPRLYASCDCLVHPYRGEGYGLTVAEGMACGLPVIVPAGGSTADFCDTDTALLVPSYSPALEATRVGDLELTGPVRIMEVLPLDLAQRMRDAYEGREAAREMGRRASAHMHANHTWDDAAAIAAERLRTLSGRVPTVGAAR